MRDLEKLIDDICNAEYEYINYQHETTKTTVVSRYSSDRRAARGAVAKTVYEWASSQMSDYDLERKGAALEAKCFVYEQIISNSNFKPMIEIASTKERSIDDNI